MSFSLIHVLQFLVTSTCAQRPHHQFSLYSYFSIPYLWVLTFSKGELKQKHRKIQPETLGISESRNSCRVKVNGVGVAGMISLNKSSKSSWDWINGSKNSTSGTIGSTTGFEDANAW